MKKCLENNLTVIRLLQYDVWYDKNNWEELLQRELIVHEYNIYIDEMQA
jgi:hypothetical protein